MDVSIGFVFYLTFHMHASIVLTILSAMCMASSSPNVSLLKSRRVLGGTTTSHDPRVTSPTCFDWRATKRNFWHRSAHIGLPHPIPTVMRPLDPPRSLEAADSSTKKPQSWHTKSFPLFRASAVCDFSLCPVPTPGRSTLLHPGSRSRADWKVGSSLVFCTYSEASISSVPARWGRTVCSLYGQTSNWHS